MKTIEEIEAVLASFKKNDGRPGATVTEINHPLLIPRKTIYGWIALGWLTWSPLTYHIFADGLVGAITHERRGGSYPHGRVKRLQTQPAGVEL